MTGRPARFAIAAASVAYLVASQWLMLQRPPPQWSAFALLTPPLLVAALVAWRREKRAWSAAALLVLLAFGWQAYSRGGFAPEHLYVAENVTVEFVLAFWFGSTLRRGSRPLIARFADRVHHLTPAMERYTRRLTLAWTIYFASIGFVSLGVALVAPFTVWQVFAAVVTPLALVAMFVGEHVLRYRLHPEFERVSMRDTLRAYAQTRRGVAGSTPEPRR